MRPWISALLVAALALSASQPLPAAEAAPVTHVLYDGALGTPPEAQGLFFFGAAVPVTAGGATTLDTSANDMFQAGYTISPTVAITLDRAAGYQVIFTAQLITETHASNDRAGFSVIVLSRDKLGIELGFWRDRVWAQEGGAEPGLFTQAEGAAFDTTGLATYTLTLTSTAYTLSAGGAPLLSGPVRDYTAFAGSPDVYETPNVLFFGDNTGSARASVRFSYVAVDTALHDVYLPVVLR